MISQGDLVRIQKIHNKFLIPSWAKSFPIFGIVFEENETAFTKEKVYFVKILGFNPDEIVGPLYSYEIEKII